MSENRQTTDSELLLQIVGYNAEAFEQLFNRYSATVYSLIKEIVSNPKLAEKILLNVFSVFLKRIEYYSTTGNDIFTWLTLLTRNISVDALKRMKFVEDIPVYSDEYEVEFILPNLSKVIAPINLDERTALGEKIKLYKSHLTEVQNLVLSLVYFEGLDEEEIAKRLSVPVVTVRQKILSIMESLHHQYTGKTEDANSNKKVLTLIKLDALRCLTSEERALLNEIRKNDLDFLWTELGEYQNLTALLATPIPIGNPAHELNAEIRDIFVKISGGSEVNHSILAAEPDIIKQFQEPIQHTIQNLIPSPVPETIQNKIQNPIPETNEHTEVQERKKTGFEFKFRERDPKELSVLKNAETVELKKKIPTELAKTHTKVKLTDYNIVVNKPSFFVDKKENLSADKVSIPVALKAESTIEHKSKSVETGKKELIIENDDPSIIIEQPKPVMVKEDVVVKNRLIPNSTINLKELFKKDERPIFTKESTPVKTNEEKKIEEKPNAIIVEKSDIKLKVNEPPKEINSIFVNKDKKPFQNMPIVPIVEKNNIVNKTNELSKDIQRTEKIVLKEETAVKNTLVEPLVERSDVKIKVNEPPKDFNRSSIFVNKDEKSIKTQTASPVVQKQEITIKTNEAPKEIQKLNPVVVKEEKIVAAVMERSDIKIKTNEPPKEFSRSNIFVDREQKTAPAKSNLNIVEKSESEIDKNELIKENQTSTTTTTVEEKPIEFKLQQVSANSDIKPEIQETIIPKGKIDSEVKKDENLFERIKPSADKSNLKIRETIFAENDKKPEVVGQEINAITPESKQEAEKINPVSVLTESINIDEILSKIENEEPAPVDISESVSYEKEIAKHQKKSRKTILAYAATFVIIITSSIFVYLKFQEAPVKVSNKVNNFEEVSLAGQTNLPLNRENNLELETEDPVKTTETFVPEKSLTNPNVIVPPLPEISIKEESTLSASNIKESLMNDINNENTQIAAAKTETIVPPKENKVIEEEPAFFVAVEEMPELVGGLKTLQGKIKYPEIAKRVGVEGKVIVQAVVDENGKVISVNAIKGIGSGCDEVAMDAVLSSTFTPGKQRGKNVKVQVTIPIVFKK